MSDLEKGYTFSGTSPNNSVTAEKLNTLVDSATIVPGFYTGKTENLSAADSDYLLLYEAASGTYRKIQKRNLVTQGKAATGFRNLLITNRSAAPTTQLDVTADEIVLRSSDGNVRRASSFAAILDVTADAGAATANGRDFTTLAAHTFYGVWAISDGANDRALLSTALSPGASPSLPAGYTYAAMLGVIKTAAAGALPRATQRGCEVAITPGSAATVSAIDFNPSIGGVEFGNGSGGVQINALALNFSDVNLSKCVPALACRVRGTLGCTVSSATLANVSYAVAAKGSGDLNGTPSDTLGLQIAQLSVRSTATFGFFSSFTFESPLHTAQTLAVASSDNSARHALRIHGYTLNL